MSDDSLVAILQDMCDESNSSIILAYLKMAKQIVINKAYPFSDEVTDVPDKYTGVLLEITAYLLNKRGAEGELAHSENGISRTYDSSSVPNEILKKIIPAVGVL